MIFREQGENKIPLPKIQRWHWTITAFVALAALVLFASGSFMRGLPNPEKQLVMVSGGNTSPAEKSSYLSGGIAVTGNSVMSREEALLATRLKEVLEKIEGAGRVEVTVRLATSSHSRYAINSSSGVKTTEEKDQGGGRRVINEKNDSTQLVMMRGSGSETPVLEQEQAARIAGVLVVAEGARDARVKERLFNAVKVALGCDPHLIIVLPAVRG